MCRARSRDDHRITALLLTALLGLALAFTAGACARESPGASVDAGPVDACPVEMPADGDHCPDPEVWNCQWVAETCACDDDLHWACSCGIFNEWSCFREWDCYPCPGTDAGVGR